MAKDKNLFGDYMKALREVAVLTFDEAASVLKTSPDEIQNWETKQNLPNQDLWEKIAVVYKVSVQELAEIIEMERSLLEDKR